MESLAKFEYISRTELQEIHGGSIPSWDFITPIFNAGKEVGRALA